MEQLPRHIGESERDFLGRDEEVAQAQRLIASGVSVLTIWGPPGVGKTRLATELARLSAQPVPMCTLAEAHTEEEVLQTIASELGVPRLDGDSIESARAQLGRALSQASHPFLVLDNAEHVAATISMLLGHWTNRPAFVITSRQPIGRDDEQFLALEPMTKEAAIALFRRRASVHDGGAADFDDNVLAELVEELDRLPLAIELAAARCAIMTPRDILGRMHQRFALLAPAASQVGRRVQRLEASIELSWRTLGPDEAAALAVCSLFRGTFDRDAAGEIFAAIGLSTEAADMLQRLTERALVVRVDEERYRLLVSIGAFAKDRLAEVELASAGRDAYLDHFARRAREETQRLYTLDGMDARDWMRANAPNLTQVAAELVEDERDDDALGVLIALRTLPERSGLAANQIDRLNRLKLEGPRAATVRDAAVATLLLQTGDVDAAMRRVECAQQHEGADDCRALHEVRARVHTEKFQPRAAHASLERAIETAIADGEHYWRLEHMRDLASLRCNMKTFGFLDEDSVDETGRLIETAERESRELVSPLHRAPFLRTLGLFQKGCRGDLARANESYVAAVEVARQAGDLIQVSGAYRGLSAYYRDIGDSQQAYEQAKHAYDIVVRFGVENERMVIASEIGQRAYYIGLMDEAKRWFEEAIELATENGQHMHRSFAVKGIIPVLLDLREFEEVRAAIEWLEGFDAGGSTTLNGLLKTYQAVLCAVEGDIETARELCRQGATELAGTTEQAEVLEQVLLARVEVWRVPGMLREGDVVRAQQLLAEIDAQPLEELEPSANPNLVRSGVRSVRLDTQWMRQTHEIPDDVVHRMLRLGPGATWFELDGERVELGHREVLCRLMNGLFERQVLDVAGLFEVGWPGETIDAISARNRVYAQVRILRKMGLEGVLVSAGGMYSFADDVYVVCEQSSKETKCVV